MLEEAAEETQVLTELEQLKLRATELGITFGGRIGVTKLKNMIANATKGTVKVKKVKTPSKPKLTKEQRIAIQEASSTPLRVIKQKEANRLRRVRITCMNPAKADWDGQIFSVGNSHVGTFKKYIPFNVDAYHVPEILYRFIKTKECTVFKTVKTRSGGEIKKGFPIKEFAIEDLSPLTDVERKTIADRQAAQQSIDE